MKPSNHLSELARRCEEGEGGDRELEFLIADALGSVPQHSIRDVGWDYQWWRRSDDWTLWKANDSEGRNVSVWSAPKVTSSLDAAVAFVERMLPGLTGWDMSFVAGNEPPHDVKVWRELATRPVSGSAKSPARALTAAALRALAQKDQDNG